MIIKRDKSGKMRWKHEIKAEKFLNLLELKETSFQRKGMKMHINSRAYPMHSGEHNKRKTCALKCEK